MNNIMNKREYNLSEIDYYNTNNLLINTPIGVEYGGVSSWQGIRYLGTNTYLICGTTTPTSTTGNGLIYIGNINCIDGKVFYLNVPDSISTSVYGPNYEIDSGIFTFVGSFLDYQQNTSGFIYQGNLDELSLKNNSNFKFPTINMDYDINFFHSFTNNLFIGNSGNSNDITNSISYIYDIKNINKIKAEIKFPLSLTTTSYGIVYNGNQSYTIVGGYSSKNISLEDIYKNGNILPQGKGFIVDYNEITNIFTNWTSIEYTDSDTDSSLITHFQGITLNINGTYSLNANILNLKESIFPIGYYLTISRNIHGSFIYNFDNWIKLEYSKNGTTSSNSVANNKVIGLYISGNENISYQLDIKEKINLSKSNKLISVVEKDELIIFNNTFSDNSSIDNKNNKNFTFLEKATYFIDFNIYVKNTNLPSVNFSVEYTINGKKENFIISQKGIDEIGTGTAHSLTIPCSFINNFNINDTLSIRNVSEDSVTLISNYLPEATNAIISIFMISR